MYLIDFGLAKRYLCPKSGDHVPFKQNKGLTGTVKYISLSGHLGNEHSRRDDLEALGNIVIYFLNNGRLPWDIPKPKQIVVDIKDPKAMMLIKRNEDSERKYNQDVMNAKKNLSLEELC